MQKYLQLLTIMLIITLVILFGETGYPSQVKLTVSAASSLQGPLEEIKRLYREKKPDVNLIFNFGASGALQHQIEQGAPVDIIIPAAAEHIQALEAQGMLLAESQKHLLTNKLVLIAPNASKLVKDFSSLSDDQVTQVAIGEPNAVPAGKYAKEVLVSGNLWDKVIPKIIYAKNVRQVLTYVETGNVDAGLVYFSDAKNSSKVQIIAEAPDNSHSSIIYPVAVLKRSEQCQASQEFVDFLSSAQCLAVFQKYGFQPNPGRE